MTTFRPVTRPLSADAIRDKLSKLGSDQFARIRTTIPNDDYVGLASLTPDGNVLIRTNNGHHTLYAAAITEIEPLNSITEESRALAELLDELNRVNPDAGTGWYVELHDLSSAAQGSGRQRRVTVWKLTDDAAREAGWLD